MSEYQEEVLTNLLDLQAELRGDEPEPREERAAREEGDETAAEDDGRKDDTVTVTLAEQGVAVSVAPTGLPVNERLAALNERLAHLEQELAGVTKRIARIEPDEEDLPTTEETDVDAPWRSFIDLQRIVADRLDQS